MVARLLLLASDASIATKMDDNNSSTLIRITQTLSSVLNSINTHAYMSTHKADKALLLLSLLMKESKPKGRYFSLPEHKALFRLPVVCRFPCFVIHSFFDQPFPSRPPNFDQIWQELSIGSYVQNLHKWLCSNALVCIVGQRNKI
jgi:hypothetical protein